MNSFGDDVGQHDLPLLQLPAGKELNCLGISVGVFQDPAKEYLILERPGGRITRLETRRMRQLDLAHTLEELGLHFYDPRQYVPLDGPQEESMKQMGPAAYLQWICREYGLNVNPIPATETECALAARTAVRSLNAYQGEKFIQ